MEIVIKGEPKEIAALVVAIQERRDVKIDQIIVHDEIIPYCYSGEIVNKSITF